MYSSESHELKTGCDRYKKVEVSYRGGQGLLQAVAPEDKVY